ncbi:hypothetical protein HYX70_01650 [Candidatus Saccharibacteria bacterium]|nr:hypothetical protein [Candidatus Saccharibacteria bacterium]
MHKPTLIKLAVGVVLIVAVVAATFWYGNMQRVKQTKSNQSSNQSQSNTQSKQELTVPEDQKPKDQASQSGSANKPAQTPTPDQPTPLPAPSTTPPAQSSNNPASMPATGGETSVIPLTILATLAYMYWRSRKPVKP